MFMFLREAIMFQILVVFGGNFIKAGLTKACVEFVFTRSLNMLELLSNFLSSLPRASSYRFRFLALYFTDCDVSFNLRSF